MLKDLFKLLLISIEASMRLLYQGGHHFILSDASRSAILPSFFSYQERIFVNWTSRTRTSVYFSLEIFSNAKDVVLHLHSLGRDKKPLKKDLNNATS